MRLSGRGKALAVSALAAAALGAAARDPILLSAGAAMGAALLADSIALRRIRASARKSIRILPESTRGTTVAGEGFSADLLLENAPARAAAGPTADAPFSLEASSSPRGLAARVSLKPALFGIYKLGWIELGLRSPLGAFASSAKVEADVEVKAYPRFYLVLLEALSVLEGGAAEGDAPSSRRGRGMEYAWSREYEPGDSMKLIDWKTTARRAKYCVKDFYEERGEGAWVIFDGRAPGPISADAMARDLLSALVGCAREGRRVFLLVERDNGSHRKFEGSAEEALRAALSEIFEGFVEAAPEIFALFPPAVRSSLLRAIKNEGRGLGDGSSVEGKNARGEVVKMTKEGRIGDLIYVGCPLYAASEAIGMISEVVSHGARVATFMPTKPWLDAPNLEDAYEVRVSWERTLRAIENATSSLHPMNYPVHARGA